MVKSNSEYRSIRKKLMAAIAMVLVASIMMVSASYAWFTLSTAPEVTGITTSIGSNGNLEIALRTGDLNSITTSDGGLTFPDANTTWGNLVDLSDESYHLDEMQLRPSRLNITEDVAAKQVQKTKDNVPVWSKGTSGQTGYVEGAADVDPDGTGTVWTAVEDTTTQKQKVKNGVPVWYRDKLDDNGAVITETVTVDGQSVTRAVTYEFAADNDLIAEFSDISSTDDKVFDPAYKLSTAGFLKTPEYGADGRISLLDAGSILNGLYDETDGAFKQADGYGIRAVGVSSSISPAALKLRNAKQAVNAAIASTKTSATISLRDDSVKLADIIVAYTLNANTKFGKTNVDNISGAIKTLEGIKGELEASLKQAVVAVGAYQEKTFKVEDVEFVDSDNNDVYESIKINAKETVGTEEKDIVLDWDGKYDTYTDTEIGADPAPAYKDMTEDGATVHVKLDAAGNPVYKYESLEDELEDLLAAYNKLATLQGELDTAKSKLPQNPTADSQYSFDDLDDALTTLLNPNDFAIIDSATGTSYDVPAFKSLADTAPLSAVKIILATPTISIKSGAYHTVAEFSGNYSATTSMTITGSYGGVSLNNETITVVMATAATEGTAKLAHFHLPYVVNWLSSLEMASDGSSNAPLITDIYGYVVDLAFRTNATDSSLLLQTEAVNRVDDSSATQGGGSYMEFKSGHQDFTLQQVANLMQSIRVVFTDESGSALYGIGMLEVELKPVYADTMTKAEYDAAVTAGTPDVSLYKAVPGEDDLYAKVYSSTVNEFIRVETTADALFKDEGVKRDASGVITKDPTTNEDVKCYYAVELVGAEVTQGSTAIKSPIVLANYTVDGAGVLTVNDAKATNTLMELPVNTPVALSALVYLDGDTVENADVAISGTSMTGTMNLQFASDATLDPMDYTYAQMTKPNDPAAPVDGVLTIPVTKLDDQTYATSYDIYVDGAKADNIPAATDENDPTKYVDTTYNLSALRLAPGKHNIQVAAKAFNYADSDKTTAVAYDAPLHAPSISVVDGKLSITSANGTYTNVTAAGETFQVHVNGGTGTEITSGAKTLAEIVGTTAGDYTITVTAHADGFVTSVASNALTYTVGN